MDCRITITAALIALSTVACASRPSEAELGAVDAPAADETSADAVAAADVVADVPTEDLPSMTVAAIPHDVTVSETVIAPDGHAALTLDVEGGVRLWPEVRDAEAARAFEVPVSEPVWMSLAKTKGGYVAAFIDTVGGGVVGKLRIEDGVAKWTVLYEHPATEPLFELHVLDGGARLVALRVDHRVQLWTSRGEALATLDQAGFVPWQLRVTQPGEGGPHVVAVLAGPTRVQPIALSKDSLEITGEPRTVALDRGPNRNDLTLSPDGKVVTALRRPKARSKRYELEIIDIASGTRKIVAAESDTKGRPRVHPLSSERALIETGSGQGFYLDYAAGTPWPPAEGEPNRETIPNTMLTGFAMTHAAEDDRWHSVIAHGTRFVPTALGLAVVPLDETAGFELTRDDVRPTAIGLDDDGDRLLLGTSAGVELWDVADDVKARPIAGTASSAALVSFVGEGKVLAMAANGAATLHRIADGQKVADTNVRFEWGLAHTAWRHGEADGRGFLVLSSVKPSEPAHVVEVADAGFGATRDVARDDRFTWPEGGKPRNAESSDWIGQLGLDYAAMGLRRAEVTITEPAPGGDLMLVGQKIGDRGHWDEERGAWVDELGDYVITMVERDTGKKLWTRRALGLADTTWSGNGKRFAFATEEGVSVLDARSGTELIQRTARGLTIKR